MSRGPGHVERAIEATFTENPTKRFYVEDLCFAVYNGGRPREISENERRAVHRAATKVAKRMGWKHNTVDVKRSKKFDTSADRLLGRRAYFESEQAKKARFEKVRAERGHDPLPPPEPTPRELAAKARQEELARLRAELPDTLAKERDELLARKERLEIELDEVDAGLEALRLRAFHMSQTPQSEWIV